MIFLQQSCRARAITASHIPTVNTLVQEYPGTISLGQGVVHYGPPPEVSEGLGRFFADPENHKYKAEQGIPALIEAFRTKLEAENGFQVGEGSRVIVTGGQQYGFFEFRVSHC